MQFNSARSGILNLLHPLRKLLPSQLLKMKLATAALSTLVMIGATAETNAAERFGFNNGIFGGSVPIASIEAFVADGTIDVELAGYLRGLDPKTQEQIRIALTSNRKVDPILFSQQLYTPMGELLMRSGGLTMQPKPGINGQQALRAALTKAAFAPEGVSLLNAMRYYPTAEMHIDLQR